MFGERWERRCQFVIGGQLENFTRKKEHLYFFLFFFFTSLILPTLGTLVVGEEKCGIIRMDRNDFYLNVISEFSIIWMWYLLSKRDK